MPRGDPPSRSAKASRKASTTRSALTSDAAPRPRLDSGPVRVAATASPTWRGVWVPPGPSKWASPACSAGNCARRDATSKLIGRSVRRRQAAAWSARDELVQHAGEPLGLLEMRKMAGAFEEHDAGSREDLQSPARVPGRDHVVAGAPDDEGRDVRPAREVAEGTDRLATRVDHRTCGGQERPPALRV